jgi:hypothetical protein
MQAAGPESLEDTCGVFIHLLQLVLGHPEPDGFLLQEPRDQRHAGRGVRPARAAGWFRPRRVRATASTRVGRSMPGRLTRRGALDGFSHI